MKPKIICSKCNNPLTWNDKFCAKCGEPVERPGAAKSPGGEKKKTSPVTNSWKLVAGFFAVLLAIILIIEFNKKPPVVSTAQPMQQVPPDQSQTAPQGPNMAAINEINDLEAQVKANPESTQLTLQLANLLHDNRFYEKAVTYYKAYLAKKPKDPNARVDMGICYKELGNLEEAKKEMMQALKAEPQHVFAMFNLGIVALTEGNLEESNQWFKKTVEIAPNSDVGQRAKQLLAEHSSMKFPQLQ